MSQHGAKVQNNNIKIKFIWKIFEWTKYYSIMFTEFGDKHAGGWMICLDCAFILSQRLRKKLIQVTKSVGSKSAGWIIFAHEVSMSNFLRHKERWRDHLQTPFPPQIDI
jgi:hypothetical protein